MSSALWVLGLSLCAEAVCALNRFEDRRAQYRAAYDHARRSGKPLVVVGDPDAGYHTGIARAYGCGDLCVDLNGCPACPRAVAVDLTRDRIPVPDGGAVVYVSCVLEYVPDIEAAWREIMRAAGSVQNVFLVTVQPGCGTAALHPGARWVVERDAATGTITYREVTSARKLAYGGGVAAALVLAARGV